uniref:Uncharacterized protein n=1 Tax=mine drainage metagenome TaxID=410659 RepID=E6PEL0_9ZZZZ
MAAIGLPAGDAAAVLWGALLAVDEELFVLFEHAERANSKPAATKPIFRSELIFYRRSLTLGTPTRRYGDLPAGGAIATR